MRLIVLLMFCAAICAATLYAHGAANEAKFPVKVVDSMLLVPVVVNGRRLTFILDSGASSSWLLDRDIASKLNLIPQGEQPSSGAGGNGVVLPLVHDLEIAFGNQHYSHVTAGVTDLLSLSQYLNIRIDGVVGEDAFRHSIIAIDYCGQQIETSDPSRSISVPSKATVVPIVNTEGFYAAKGEVKFSPEIQLNGLFILDTGAGPITVGITREQGQRLHTDPNALHDALPAMGGTFRASLIRAESVALGDVVVPDVTVHASENTSGVAARGAYVGFIGGGFFRRFVTIFDVPHQRLILKPAVGCK
jgi:predicted aspartyl protease